MPVPAAEAALVEVEIAGLGHSGDGIAEIGGRRVFVPLTAPGDRVAVGIEAGDRAIAARLLSPGPHRAAPACRHFGVCGGCALQHLAPGPYAAFKRGQIVRALAHRGFADPPVAEAVIVPPGSRRRVSLSALRPRRGAALVGFAARGSRTIVDLGQCPVMLPELERLLEPLRALLGRVMAPGARAEALLTSTETGIELALRSGDRLDLARREALADFAASQALARLVWDGEIGLQRAAPMVRFGGIAVEVPPAPFLQPTAAGEAALVAAARAATAGASRIADLFCGSGAFALPLSGQAKIDAFDADAPAIAALSRAAGQARRGVHAGRRDLFRRPLEPAELGRYDAVVLDPPHAGARAQVERLARAAVPCVVMVSCNPATFARDARILAEGGYALESVTPVDQFLWSAEVELVGVLRRRG